MGAPGLLALLILCAVCCVRADESLLDLPTPAATPLVAQCGAGSWRGLPLASQPTPNAEFDPLTVDYYRGTVVKAVWPTAIGLGFTLLVFLYYLLWRCFRCCGGGCCGGRGCCCCCGGRSWRSKLEKIHAARCQSTYKALSFLLLLGTAGGCAYGMAMVNIGLVSQGQGAIDSVKGFIMGVLAAANSTLLQVQQLDSVIVDILGVVDNDINAADIVAKLRGLRLWMEALPDPAALSAQIVAARALVDDVLTPQLAVLNSALGGLLTHLQDGSYSGALDTVAQAQTFVASLTQQAGAITAAVAGLPDPAPPTNGTEGAKLQALSDALRDLSTLPNIPTKGARLQGLQASLGLLSTALVADRFVAKSFDGLGKVTAAAATLLGTPRAPGSVLSIGAALQSMQTTYAAAAPFMAGLLQRVESINATVLVLPADLQANVALLSQAKGTLDDIMAGPNPPGTLANQLTTAAAGFAMPASTDAALAQLGNMASVLANVSDPTPYSQYDWSGAILQLQSLDTIIQNLKTAVDACIASSCMVAAPATYATMYSNANSVLGQLSSTGPLKPVFDIKSQGGGLFTQAGVAKAMIGQLGSGQQLQNLQDQADMVTKAQAAEGQMPATGPYMAVLGSFEPIYAALPQPPAQLLLDAQHSVESIVTEITSKLDDGHATIQGHLSDVQQQLDDIRQQSVGKIQDYEGQYMPMVKEYERWRLAALFVALGLGMLLATLLWVATFTNWPAGIKSAMSILLLLLMLYWVVLLAFSAVLKVGSDVCTNVEAQVIMRIQDSSTGDKQKILAVANYYIYNEGGSLEQVLQSAFNINITDAMAQINSTRDDLLKKVQPPDGYQLQPLLSREVDKAVNISYGIQSAIWGLLDSVDYSSVHSVYTVIKKFGCCTMLDVVGGLWVGLVTMGCCSLVMCTLAMSAIRAMDKLPAKGCCRRYKASEFVSEPGLPFPVMPETPQKGGPLTLPTKHQYLISVATGLPSPSQLQWGSFGGDTRLLRHNTFIPAARTPSAAIPASLPASRTPSCALPASPSALTDSNRELLAPCKSGGGAKDR